MRIVIDLQACQQSAGTDVDATVALLLAVAQAAPQASDAAAGSAPGPALTVLLHNEPGGQDAVLRTALQAALAPLLDDGRVRLHNFDTPRSGGAWRERASALLRDTVLRDLRAEIVWTPAAMTRMGASATAGAARAVLAALLGGAPLAPELGSCRVPDTTAVAATAAAARPTLAFLSPLPPQHSGIADYSVELLAQLERYYDIELIVDGPLAPALAARYTVRDCAWFERHAAGYGRVLYHFGNNGVHQHLFALLRRHPGIVVLHDFFLSGVLDNMERDGYTPHAFLHALYASHGYAALQAHTRLGRNPAIWAYPCNKEVLDHASGVIVHSDFSRRLARHWYGDGCGADWQTVPLIRGLPDGHDAATARTRARAALGIADDAFVVCSFGMMGVTKLNALLLEAFLASPLAADPRCQLVFVGAPDPGDYGRAMAARRDAAGLGTRIAVTGFVSAEQYGQWLAAADTAVQLRSQTRGETSASVLDCLLYGLPTVVNAHGSNTDLPPDVLVMLADDCDSAALAAALTQLHADANGRRDLAARARRYMAAHHAPAQVGPRFADAIEALHRDSPASHYATLLAALRQLPPPPRDALMETAEAIAANRLPTEPRQLFVDISAVVENDLKTGIQRVVRAILLRLIEAPPPGYRVEPVWCNGGNRPYRYARNYMLNMLGYPGLGLEDAPLELRAGDLFLGLDLYTNGTAQNRERLQAMRRRGVQLHFVIYDLLPLLQPQMFPHGADVYFAKYIDTVGAVADSLICISRAVADDVHAWLAAQPERQRRDPLALSYFHLGADIDASAPSFGLPDDADRVLAAIAARPSLLMVGTLEPRKGQAQALEALELLWQQGVAVNLVIVGKQGWMVDALVQRLRTHPELGQRLFWLAGVSDEMLLKLYGACAALLAASTGEGFGLPLIEAAQHGLPVIARSLPVFREVGGEHAYYFDGADAASLAATLAQWLALHADGKAPPSSAMPWLTWHDSAAQLLDAVQGRRVHRVLAPSPAAGTAADQPAPSTGTA